MLEQALSVAAVQAAGVVFLLVGDHPWGLALAIAGLVVQLGLGLRYAVLIASRRDICLDLIIEGRGALPLACVRRDGERVLKPERLAQLAGCIEAIVEIAVRPPAGVGIGRPLQNSSVVRRRVGALRRRA